MAPTGPDRIGGGLVRDLASGGVGNVVIEVGRHNWIDAERCGRGWGVAYVGRLDVADRSCGRVIRTQGPSHRGRLAPPEVEREPPSRRPGSGYAATMASADQAG